MIATVGIATHSLNQDHYLLILTTTILTMLLTPFVSGQTARLYSLKKRMFQHEPLETLNMPKTELSGHVVIVGGGRVGLGIAGAFKEFGLPALIVELDHSRI